MGLGTRVVLVTGLLVVGSGFVGVAGANHRMLCHGQLVAQLGQYIESPAGCLDRGLGSTLEPSGALGATDPDVLALNPGGAATISNRVLDSDGDKDGDGSPASEQQDGATSDLVKVRALFNSGADGGFAGSHKDHIFLDSTIANNAGVASTMWGSQYYTGGSVGQREGVGAVNPPLTGGKNLLTPGYTFLFAFLGYFSDKDGDGTIDDYEDPGGGSNPAWPATATPTTCDTQGHADKRSVMDPRDDFFWIGGKRRNLVASDAPSSASPVLGVHFWMWPGDHPYRSNRGADNELSLTVAGIGWGTDWADKDEEYYGYQPDGFFDDRTDVCTGFQTGPPVQQGWFSGSGASISNDDNSLIERTWTLTTVNAPEAPDSIWGKNIAGAAFIDIDEYDSLDDGLYATWNTTVVTNVRAIWQGSGAIAGKAVEGQTCQKSDLVPATESNLLGYIPTLDPGWAPGNVMDLWPSKCNADLALDLAAVSQEAALELAGPARGDVGFPIYWHEPNQPGDSYPAVAVGAPFALEGDCREGVGVRQPDGALAGCGYGFSAYAAGKTLWIDTLVTKFLAGCNGNPFACGVPLPYDLSPQGTSPSEIQDWKDKRAWNVDGSRLWLQGFVGFWHDIDGDGWITADEADPEPTWDCDLTLATKESHYACGWIQQPHAYFGDPDDLPAGEDETSGGAGCGGTGAVLHIAIHPFRAGAAIAWPAGTMVQRQAETFGDSISDAIDGKPIIGNDPPGSASNGAFFNPVVAHEAIDTDPLTGDGNSENDLEAECATNANSWDSAGRVLWLSPGVTDYSIRVTTTFTKDPDGTGPLPATTLADVDCLYGLSDPAPPPGCDLADGE